MLMSCQCAKNDINTKLIPGTWCPMLEHIMERSRIDRDHQSNHRQKIPMTKMVLPIIEPKSVFSGDENPFHLQSSL